MKRLFIYSGSINNRDESKTFTFANILSTIAVDKGYLVDLFHYGDAEHSPAQVPYHSNPFADGVPVDIQDFANRVAAADVIMLVSPTYHGSYTSQMKNLIDCLVEDAFRGKTILMATHGWGPSAIQPALHLQDVARTMIGNVYPRFITASTGDLSDDTIDEKKRKE